MCDTMYDDVTLRCDTLRTHDSGQGVGEDVVIRRLPEADLLVLADPPVEACAVEEGH